jgi:uncharacterized membrane protein
MTTGRVEALSDGVFAVAATVLVFGFSVPSAAPGQLANRLLNDWPAYVAYLVSFASIGIIWVNHHTAFGQIKRVDRPLLFINLILLAAVAFIPFPTAVLARYLRSPQDAEAAVVLYGATMTVVAFTFAGLFIAITARGLLHEKVDAAALRRRAPRRALGMVLWPAAIALGLASPEAALGLFVLITIFYAVDAVDPTAPPPVR